MIAIVNEVINCQVANLETIRLTINENIVRISNHE